MPRRPPSVPPSAAEAQWTTIVQTLCLDETCAMDTHRLIRVALLTGVSQHIRYMVAAVPASRDVFAAAQTARAIPGEHGDDFLFRSRRPGQTQVRFADVCLCIAVLSFSAGGIHVFGDDLIAADVAQTEMPSPDGADSAAL